MNTNIINNNIKYIIRTSVKNGKTKERQKLFPCITSSNEQKSWNGNIGQIKKNGKRTNEKKHKQTNTNKQTQTKQIGTVLVFTKFDPNNESRTQSS